MFSVAYLRHPAYEVLGSPCGIRQTHSGVAQEVLHIHPSGHTDSGVGSRIYPELVDDQAEIGVYATLTAPGPSRSKHDDGVLIEQQEDGVVMKTIMGNVSVRRWADTMCVLRLNGAGGAWSVPCRYR